MNFSSLAATTPSSDPEADATASESTCTVTASPTRTAAATVGADGGNSVDLSQVYKLTHQYLIIDL